MVTFLPSHGKYVNIVRALFVYRLNRQPFDQIIYPYKSNFRQRNDVLIWVLMHRNHKTSFKLRTIDFAI